jgi:hypothetical protein
MMKETLAAGICLLATALAMPALADPDLFELSVKRTAASGEVSISTFDIRVPAGRQSEMIDETRRPFVQGCTPTALIFNELRLGTRFAIDRIGVDLAEFRLSVAALKSLPPAEVGGCRVEQPIVSNRNASRVDALAPGQAIELLVTVHDGITTTYSVSRGL